MREIKQLILDKLHYLIVGKEYARLGAMVKRYGAESVTAAVLEIASWSFTVNNLMDVLEKQSQLHIRQDKRSEISKRIDKVTK